MLEHIGLSSNDEKEAFLQDAFLKGTIRRMASKRIEAFLLNEGRQILSPSSSGGDGCLQLRVSFDDVAGKTMKTKGHAKGNTLPTRPSRYRSTDSV